MIIYWRLKLLLMADANTSTFRESMRAHVQCDITYMSPLLSYDKLVIAVGSTSSTHGVPGLENCFQLKTISDAQVIRRRVMGMFDSLIVAKVLSHYGRQF